MTGIALHTIRPTMDIIILVTPATLASTGFYLRHRHIMTALTGKPLMSPLQRK